MNIEPDINRMHYVTQAVSPEQTTLLPGLDNVEGFSSPNAAIFLLPGKKAVQQ
jgi:hypothetical protein